MNIPVIIASESSTNSPAEVVTFDKWWIERLVIAGDQSGRVNANVSLVKFGVNSLGTMVFSGEKQNYRIPNVLSEAAENQELAGALNAIINYVGQKAVESGAASAVVVPPEQPVEPEVVPPAE